MNRKKEMENYEDSIQDVDEIQGTDLKINPDYYFHRCELKIQEALADDDFKNGMSKFLMLVDHFMVLASAAGYVDDDELKKYQDEVKASEKFKEEKDVVLRQGYLANAKLKYVYESLFDSGTSTTPLKVKYDTDKATIEKD